MSRFSKCLVALAMVLPAICVAQLVMKPGQWRSVTRIWIDGKEVLGAFDSATDEILERTRAQLPPADRPQFDRDMAEAREQSRQEREMECITPEQTRIPSRVFLENALRSLHSPPWACSFSSERSDKLGYGFHYKCRTAPGGLAEGDIKLAALENSYRLEIVGHGHVVNMETGAPLDSKILPVRSLTEGRRLGDQCAVESTNDQNEDESRE